MLALQLDNIAEVICRQGREMRLRQFTLRIVQPFFGTTMTREFEGLERAFGWNEADFAELNRVALDAAFCDAATKAKIAKLLEARP